MAVAVNPQVIDAFLRQKGSPLTGLGSAFVQTGAKYGVDPRALVAISGGETGFGTYKPSQAIHNPFGIGPNKAFSNYQQAIDYLGGLLSGPTYAGRGARTIPAISAIYAPVGASNDPRNLNSNWTRTQSQFLRELGGNPASPITGLQVAPSAGGGGIQTQQQLTAAGTPAQQGLSPQLMGALNQWLAASSKQAATGTYGGGVPQTLLAQLVAAREQVPALANAPTTGTSRYTGAIPGPIKGLDYPLGARGPLIGLPNQGTHTLFGNWESDNAVDIKVPVGTPVVAPEDGVIGSQIGALGSSDPKLQGLRVHLDGPADSFYFAHLSKLAVQPGQHVRAGQVIGYSGEANGTAHLHFASQKRDPRAYVGS